jgi:membrane protease YdiL (CAAX protease family)
MLSEKRWSHDTIARLFLGVIGTMCFGMVIAGLLQKASLGLTEEQRKFLGMVVVVLFFQVAAVAWIALFLRENETTWAEAFGFASPQRGRAIFLGVLAALVFLPVAWALTQITFQIETMFRVTPESQVLVQELQKPGLTIWQKIYFGVIAIGVAPVAEECLFRGILYPAIKQAGYRKLALWGTSILFGASHANKETFVPLVLLAIILTLLYEETDNLLAPIMAHSLFNAANFLTLIFNEPISRLLDWK